MSIAQAKRAVFGLRWHHVGFCFFWAVTFVAFVAPADRLAESAAVFSIAKSVVALVAVAVAAAAVAFRRVPYTPGLAFVAGVLLSAGSLLYYLAFFFGAYSLPTAALAVALVGVGQGMFFVMWQSFYASEGTSRTTVYIPLSALCSVVLCIAVSVLPFSWMVLCAVVLLPALASHTLAKSLAEVVPYDVEPLTPSRARMLASDMGKPVFCVCAIGFVWQIMGHLAPAAVIGSFETVMLGMSFATLAVSAVELFSPRGFDVLRVYQLLFPVVTGVFLLPTFFGEGWLDVVSVFSMFGFEVVNLLLLITCAAYASRNAFDSTLVYALCVGPTLLALIVGDVAGLMASKATLLDFTMMANALFVCVYVLAAALFLASLGRAGAKRAALERRRGQAAPSDQACASAGPASHEGDPASAVQVRPRDASAPAAHSAARKPASEGVEAGGRPSGSAGGAGAARAFVPAAAVGSPAPASPGGAPSVGSPAPVSPGVALLVGSPAPATTAPSSPIVAPAADASSASASAPASERDVESLVARLPAVEPLSPRECEVAALVARGNTVSAVARKLFISENTVRGHMKNIYRKLGVHSKQELIELVG